METNRQASGSNDSSEETHRVSELNEKMVDDADEYGAIIRFVNENAVKADEGQDSNEIVKFERLWLKPWVKIERRYNKRTGELISAGDKKTPEEWLQTDMSTGLTNDEVERRRSEFGYNELESPRENLFLKFLGFFQGPILWVMEIAVILAAGLRDWIDFGVIIGILFLNAFVGWYQEKQAGDIVEQLKAGIAMRATVVRNGQEHEIEAREIVPGDIVVLEEGISVPADGRLLADYSDKNQENARKIFAKIDEYKKAKVTDDEDDLPKGPSIISTDQSAITGESLAVDKFHGDVVFYTTGVKRGQAYMIVTDTARQSFVGRTAALVAGSNEKGHFEKVMNSIGTTLLVLVIVWLIAVWIGGFFRSVEIARPKENSLLMYTLIMLIIGVPVGLPCVTTTTMAVGAAYLARREAIVQKLTAIESLAGVDILCSDKTGTLTANRLSIHEPFVSEGVDENWMMAVAVLASSHKLKSLEPIDKVIITTLHRYPKAMEILQQGWVTHKFNPFDPVSKRITAEVECQGRRYTAAKGAPKAILKMCSHEPHVMEKFQETTQDFASRGFRSLGVAVKEEGGDWKLLGLLPLFDPPRDDTAATIAEAQTLGVRVKMLTGDAVAIAKETCKMLALGTNVYDSQRLIGGGMAGSDIFDFVEEADGFAEVFPEHKYQVVEILQKRGHLTAMTGDGVNDAPSLKKADCGIAVEGASDAARSAADVVFLDQGLSTIITSIKVARQIFHRMKAYIVYRIALCLHLEIYLTLSMIILNESIRSNLIVFIAIFADVATIAIAYDRAAYARRPVEWQLPKIWIISTILGIMLAAGTWIIRGTLFIKDDGGVYGGIVQNFGSVQEILFLEVSLTENWLIFITRGAETWPSIQLVGAVLGVDILATIFALFGWMSGPAPHGGWTDVVTVVRIYCYSIGVIVVMALVYYVLNNLPWLADLGRKDRSRKNKTIENFITELQRLTIVHEQGDTSDPYDLFHVQEKIRHGRPGIHREGAEDDKKSA